MTSLDIAQLYFNLSNKSDLEAIGALFDESTTYVSPTMGTFKGKKVILVMQQAFHDKFTTLHSQVNSVEEVEPDVFLFEYTFKGELPDKEAILSSGLEYISVRNDKILHVEIKNKR